jgi:hypothetical protein
MAPDEAPRLPDFIIGGAMKSGTTSLHHMLSAQPGVFIPEPEIFFFDIDDFEQHAEFFVTRGGEWVSQDYEARHEEYLAWYGRFFAGAPPDAMIGEDSTTYLAAREAAARIRALLPQVRMIFLLRDPASRTYSHYWHLVRSGRVTLNFEETLRHEPHTLVQRSVYRPLVQRYLDRFPREQLHFVAFERFVREPMQTLRAVASFLGLPEPAEVPATDRHRNRAQVPRVLSLQLAMNRFLRKRTGRRSSSRLARDTGATADRAGRRSPLRRLWFTSDRPPPAMKPATRHFLNELFAAENVGLGEMTGLDLDGLWYRDG